MKAQYSYLIQILVRFLSGRISFPALLSREFNRFLRVSLQPPYTADAQLTWDLMKGIEEKLLSISVNNVL